MVQHQPPRPQQPGDLAEVRPKILAPDVLEHANARDLVERSLLRDVAVIEQPHLAAPFQSQLPDPGPRILVLVAAQCDAERLHAVALGRPHHQRAPAAADVEEAFARREPQFAADVIELLLLRDIQRVIRAAVVGAGVDAARSSQRLKKLSPTS